MRMKSFRAAFASNADVYKSKNHKSCNHHASVMVAHFYGASKKRFAKTRSLHRYGADQGFGISQQAFCNAKMVFVYTKTLLATAMNAF